MYRVELPYFLGFTILILSTPFLPSWIFMMFDNILVRIAIVFVLLFLISKGPTAGIFGLMAIGIVYLERNRRKIIVASKKLDMMDINIPNQMSVKEESKPQETVPVADFSLPPRDDELPYMPADECGNDNFEPVAPSINMKNALHTIDPGSSSDRFYEQQGFGHVKGVETLSS
jgi:hypothetical protein